MMNIPASLRGVLLSLAVAGLINVPAQAADMPKKGSKPPAKATKPAKSVPPAKAAVPAKTVPPEVEGLDPVTLYQYLLAEIAAARGEPRLAAEAYMELARRLKHPVISKRATELAMQARQISWALEAARLWVDAEPSSAQALHMLALLQASGGGKPEEVEQTLARLFAASPEARATLMVQLPRMFAGMADKQQVLVSILRVTEPYAAQPEAVLVRSQAYLDAGMRTEAEAAARQALALRPGWERAALQIAQAMPLDRENAAMEELGAYGQKYPQARSARSGYLRWLISKGRSAEAKTEYLRLLNDFPQDDDIAFVVVQSAVQQGDHATAEPLIRRLIAAQHREADLLRIQLGQELEKADRPAEARSAYESVPVGRDYAAARGALATMLAKQGKVREARAVLKEAATVQPERVTAFVMAEAELLIKQGMNAESLAVIEGGLADAPNDTELLYQAGMVAERANRLDLMESHLRKLIQLKPDHAHAYNALGYTFADRNIRLDEAETLLLRALSLDGDDAAILDSVGWLYFRKGRFSQAVEYLQKSYARNQDQEVAAHLVEALWAAGRQGEARRLLDSARQANPKSELLNKLAKRLTE